MRTDLDKNKDLIIQELQNGIPRAELCRKYKCKYDTLKVRLIKWEVNHLKNPARKGILKQEIYKPSSYYTKLNGPNIHSHKLKEKLIRDQIKKHQCEICLGTTWMGKPIPIELDHINGNHYDNRIENLRILCPNCHSQTPTNSGKNIRKYSNADQWLEPIDPGSNESEGSNPFLGTNSTC